MPLARITLDSGRDIELTGLEISSTYDGLLVGYPNASMNDELLISLGKRREFPYRTPPPVHLIRPPRTRPHPGPQRRPFGPVELLPPVYCRGFFRSSRIDEELDEVLYRSWLDVVWFQDDITESAVGFVTAAVADLPWHVLAEDYEI